MLEIAKFCSMDTLELCGDLLQPGGQLETPGLVLVKLTNAWNPIFFCFTLNSCPTIFEADLPATCFFHRLSFNFKGGSSHPT